MSHRRNLITGDPILYAPDRAGRPGAFIDAPASERCPFCPGHEADTPPTLLQTGTPWRVRVFANKYPPSDRAEVIVESPDHEASFDAIHHAGDVALAYAARYRAHRDAPYVALFKNEGERAGQSIAHVHSQLVGIPFLPPRIARESAAFAAASECPLCRAVQDHRNAGLVIAETAGFVWLCPSASALPLQQWILPTRHVAELSDLSDDELSELGAMLARAARAMRSAAEAFNWGFINFPRLAAGHFYVDAFPRITTIAGLELSTGTFVEIIDPAAAAARLRE
ncbi:MAG: DUF4921 family protein [Thermoanaerobaculia bacterium]